MPAPKEIIDPVKVKQTLLRGLRLTKEEFVFIKITHVLAVLGEEITEPLVESLVQTHEKRKVRGMRRLASTLTGLAKFNRAALLQAIIKHDEDQIRQARVQFEAQLLSSISSPSGEVRPPSKYNSIDRQSGPDTPKTSPG